MQPAERLCKVDDCHGHLSSTRCIKYKVCRQCRTASTVQLSGILNRWCHKCCRFHPLSDFDGDKRTCRAKHNNVRLRSQQSEEEDQQEEHDVESDARPNTPATMISHPAGGMLARLLADITSASPAAGPSTQQRSPITASSLLARMVPAQEATAQGQNIVELADINSTYPARDHCSKQHSLPAAVFVRNAVFPVRHATSQERQVEHASPADQLQPLQCSPAGYNYVVQRQILPRAGLSIPSGMQFSLQGPTSGGIQITPTGCGPMESTNNHRQDNIYAAEDDTLITPLLNPLGPGDAQMAPHSTPMRQPAPLLRWLSWQHKPGTTPVNMFNIAPSNVSAATSDNAHGSYMQPAPLSWPLIRNSSGISSGMYLGLCHPLTSTNAAPSFASGGHGLGHTAFTNNTLTTIPGYKRLQHGHVGDIAHQGMGPQPLLGINFSRGMSSTDLACMLTATAPDPAMLSPDKVQLMELISQQMAGCPSWELPLDLYRRLQEVVNTHDPQQLHAQLIQHSTSLSSALQL